MFVITTSVVLFMFVVTTSVVLFMFVVTTSVVPSPTTNQVRPC
ncbi:MAG: hypothetical protein ACRC8Y_17270 [Chroococcales cyanobacterium]